MVLDIDSESSSFSPTILQQTVGQGNLKTLELLFLGCEAKPPYGPYHHTATLFLNLICKAIQSSSDNEQEIRVILKVYSVSQGNFPESREIETCDGVILPGSFSSAYDEEDWILKLKSLIQTELVARRRPTLGVCFGHQLYAHSFEAGAAIRCPKGPQAGRKSCNLTTAGLKFLNRKNDDELLNLYYTHGDMVEKLPSQGRAMGGNEKVPIQAAVYFADEESSENPIAVTFQAHPEYASNKDLGVNQTLNSIMKAMEERGDISEQERLSREEDARAQFAMVESDSIHVMVAVGKNFGWF